MERSLRFLRRGAEALHGRTPAGVSRACGREVDPYLDQLGFDSGKMIAEINGTRTHDIFLKRWRTRSAAGFTQDHYRDLIQYLFLEHKWDQFVLTVYLDVPSSFDEISGYVPKIERWRIKLK